MLAVLMLLALAGCASQTKRASGSAVALLLTVFWVSCGGTSALGPGNG